MNEPSEGDTGGQLELACRNGADLGTVRAFVCCIVRACGSYVSGESSEAPERVY